MSEQTTSGEEAPTRAGKAKSARIEVKDDPTAVLEPKVEDGKFHIQWSMRQNLGGGADENRLDLFVHKYTGKLIQEVERDDCAYEYDERVAGYITLWKIKSSFQDYGLNFIELLDPISQELADVAILLQTLHGVDDDEPVDIKSDPMTALFMMGRSEGFISKSLENEVGDANEITQGEVVYVEKLVVHKEFRGHGLGLFMLDAAVHVINSNMSLTLINPFPLQYEDECFHDKKRPQDYPAAGSIAADRKKLQAYYRRLGFEKIGEKLLGVWNGYLQPNLLEVEPKLANLLS